MVTVAPQACPGCGATVAVAGAIEPEHYNASAGCFSLYGELSSYTLMHDDPTFLHQLAVDTYAAQHVGERMRPIAGAFALIGLYFACERGYSGRQVQHMHMLLANRSKTWPHIAPPPHAGVVSVLDVMQARPGDERDAMLRHWSHVVWAAWAHEHERVAALVANVMGA